jgi:PAS domain S-box-containing protein
VKDAWLRRAPRVAGVLAVVGGTLVLAGWAFDLALLKSLAHGASAMKPNTAVACLLAGTALWLTPGRGARVAAAGLLLLSGTTLAQYALGRTLGIDQLLFDDPAIGTRGPGRMSVNTAIAFLLLSAALPLSQGASARWRRTAEVLGAVVILIALFGLMGFLFGVDPAADRIAEYTGMAFATALVTAAVGLGVVTAAPDSWFVARLTEPGVGGIVARRLLPIAILLPPALGWSHMAAERLHLFNDRFAVSVTVMLTMAPLVATALWGLGVVSRVEGRRRATEQAFEAGETRYRSLFDNMPDGFALCRMEFEDGRPVDFVYLDVNPAFERVTGLVTVVGRRVTEVIPRIRDTNPELFELYGRVARTGAPAEFEAYVQELGIHFHISAYCPSPGHFVAVFANVTERVRAEEALRASEQRLRTLFETVNLIVLVLDGQGRVDYVNPYFLRLTGYTRDEAVGSEWFRQFLPEAQRPPMHAVFRELIERELHPHYQNPVLTKAGEERMISWHNTVLRDPDGRAVGTLSVGEDITERLGLEDRFRQAQKMEAVGRLAGGVAHDFNNVLTAIFGYTDLLEGELPPGPAHNDLEEIRAATTRAANLTRQLLAFSRRQVLQPAVLNLNHVVENLQKMLPRLIGEDVELRTALAPDLGNASADPGQIEQVIVNLAVNARDAMPTGGRLTIETANADLSDEYAEGHQPVVPGRYVMLAVSDTGIGMAPEIRGRIFEPFFTTKDKGKGTGLGLSTVYGIVKQSGGYIWVYSEPAHGATFKIYLPRVDAPVEAPAPPRPRGPAPAGTGTILVAEDDDLLRPLIRSILEVHGYKVLDAPNARAALARAREHAGDIHLLVTDVVMPGESGRQLARQLLDVRPKLRVLYVSGYTDDAIVHHGMLEPGLHYLQKPFTPAALVGKVRDVLEAQA